MGEYLRAVGRAVDGSSPAQVTMAKLTGRVCKDCNVLFHEESDFLYHQQNHEQVTAHIQEQDRHISDLQSQISDLEAQVHDKESEIEELKEQVNDTEFERDDYKGQVEELEAEIREMESKDNG